MVPLNLKVLAKFSLWSNCSQDLDECSLACARKCFGSAPKTNLITDLARKNKHTACMLAKTIRYPLSNRKT